MKSIETLIKEFLEGLRAISATEERLSASRFFSMKAELEVELKRVIKVTDVQIVIDIDDLDEFDGESVA